MGDEKVLVHNCGGSCILSILGSRYRSGFDRAVAQAVSRWLRAAAARVCVRPEHVGFVVDKAARGAGFLRVLLFPLQIIIPPISPTS
jgi:hypothetical protein